MDTQTENLFDDENIGFDLDDSDFEDVLGEEADEAYGVNEVFDDNAFDESVDMDGYNLDGVSYVGQDSPDNEETDAEAEEVVTTAVVDDTDNILANVDYSEYEVDDTTESIIAEPNNEEAKESAFEAMFSRGNSEVLDGTADDVEDDLADNGFADAEFAGSDFADSLEEDDQILDESGADIDGTEVSLEEAGFTEGDAGFKTIDNENSSFINVDGEIQVMERSNDENTFEIMYIDIDKISIAANRIRKSVNVEELVISVQNNGLLEPVVVAPTQTEGIYVLVAGFRRVLACAKAGIRKVPCIVNNRIRTLEIPIIEALYNHNKQYTMREIIDYIDYLEREKGIASASMIEHLLMLDNGDYAKLKDILEDDDPDIVEKLLEGQATIAQAFKTLEQKRKKQSKEEKELQKAAKVYGNADETGASELANSGEAADESVALTDEEIKEITSGATDFDDADDEDLRSMVDESNDMAGYKYDKQTPGDREGIDPAIRKAVITRDNGRCVICGFGGAGLESLIDVHHILGVANGQDDNPDDCCCLCITDHMAVESWAYGRLPITGIEEMTEDEQKRMKRIIKLGNVKRNYMIKIGMKREQIKEAGKEGTKLRRMPGAGQPRA